MQNSTDIPGFSAETCDQLAHLLQPVLEFANQLLDLGLALGALYLSDLFRRLVKDRFGANYLPLDQQRVRVVYGFLVGDQCNFGAVVNLFLLLHIIENKLISFSQHKYSLSQISHIPSDTCWPDATSTTHSMRLVYQVIVGCRPSLGPVFYRHSNNPCSYYQLMIKVF